VEKGSIEWRTRRRGGRNWRGREGGGFGVDGGSGGVIKVSLTITVAVN